MPHDCWSTSRQEEERFGLLTGGGLDSKMAPNGVGHLPTGDVASDLPFHANLGRWPLWMS